MRLNKLFTLIFVGLFLLIGLSTLAWRLFFPHYHWHLGEHFTHNSWFHQNPTDATPAPVENVTSKEKKEREDFASALALIEKKSLPEAEKALLQWLQEYPHAPQRPEVLHALGQLRIEAFYADPSKATTQEEKSSYSVARGDSLARIAAVHHISPELLKRLNQLPNTHLHVGQKLMVPALHPCLQIALAEQQLLLFNKGKLLQSYTLLDKPSHQITQAKFSEKATGKASGKIEGHISDKAVFQQGQRLSLDRFLKIKDASNLEYIVFVPHLGKIIGNPSSSQRSSSAEVKRAGAALVDSKNKPIASGAYSISAEQMQELYPFLIRGVPVTLEDQAVLEELANHSDDSKKE